MGVPANFTTRSAVASASAQKQRVLLTSNIVTACVFAPISESYNWFLATTPYISVLPTSLHDA